MSITDELRKEARAIQTFTCMAEQAEQLTAIADRIDAEHKRVRDGVYADKMDANGWIRLPKDADGETWHIGDRTESGQTIEAMGLNKHGWHFVGTVNEIDPSIHRHYHAPTVEDVLTEFGIDWEHESDCEDRAALLKEYAAKLRLAEGEDA